MDTIKELYYGNIHPYEREIKKDSEIDRLAKLVLRHDTELRKTLNDSETELFGKLKDAWSELTCLNECENFINGFRLGVRLTAESLQETEYGKTAALSQRQDCQGFCTLFRRVSPCVRFVGKRRESTR